MRVWIVIVLTLVSAPLAWAARPADVTIPKAKLDAYFDAFEKGGLMSGTIAISQRGAPSYQRFLGFASIDATGPSPTDAGTRYRIGPVSKLFTAVLTMQLVERASIGLDSRLAEFFPELPNALDITYRDLLQQRSGLTNYTDLPQFGQWRLQAPPRPELFAALGAPSPPRSRVERSDTDYLLLSYIVEKVHEQRYADLVRRQIANRVGLMRTYLPDDSRPSPLESRSYYSTESGWKPDAEVDPRAYLGAGGLVSSPADLVRFLDALFAGKLLTAQSLATMRGSDGEPGAGLVPWTAAGRTGYGQSGAIDHHATWIWHSPETGISIAVTTNASTVPLEEIVDEVLALIFERGHKPRLPLAPRK